jgi:hypothetical protein
LNLLSAPEGIIAFKEEFPRLRIVTAFVDEGLDSRKYLVRCRAGLTLDSSFLDVATLETGSLERIIKRRLRKGT